MSDPSLADALRSSLLAAKARRDAALADAHLVPDTLVAEAIRDERQRIRKQLEQRAASWSAQLGWSRPQRAALVFAHQAFADLLDGDGDE